MSVALKKIRVVVVDDEPLEINLIKMCIDWKFFNMEIVGEAENAILGLNLVEELSPDILFTDINMPIIDGIKFSEMVIQKHPKTKIVILSGYDDFNYVQKSIKIGVLDFLLKPINNDEVFKTASKLKHIIDYERESTNEYNLLKKQLSDNLPYIKEKFLIELLSRNFETEKTIIINKALFLGLRFKYQSVQVAAIEINSLSTDYDNVNTGTYFIRNIKIMNMIKEFFQRDEFIYISYDTLNRIIILNNNENIDLFERCETLKTKIVDNIQYSVSIGLGGIKKQIWEIHTSYKEALDALKYRVTVGNDIVILYDHINIGNNNIYDINELNEKMSFYLKSGLYEKATFLVNKYFENIDLKRKNTLKDIIIIAMNIIAINFKILIAMGIDNTDEMYNLRIASFNELLLLDTLPDIIKFLHKIIFKSIETINAQQTSKIDDIIIKAKKYIDDNLGNNELALSLIAKHLYLNPSYLSRMFKKEIGINFVEYLTKIRMEKAIELLKEGRMKAFEIADSIGISDPNYFSTCFKKYTGLSISEYKKSYRNDLSVR